MRIRRRPSGHDQITTLAAERDAALRARDAWRRMAQGDTSQSDLPMPEDRGLATQPDDSYVSPYIIDTRDPPTRADLWRSDLWGWWPAVKAVSLCLMVAALFVGGFFWLSSLEDTKVVDSTSRRLSRIEGTQKNTIDIQQDTIKVQDDSIRKLKEAMVRLEEAMRIAKTRIYDERYGNQQQTPAIAPTPKAATAVCDGPSLDCGNRQGQYKNQSSYDNNVVLDDGPQVDVRARTGDRGVRDPGSSYAEQSGPISSGFPYVRKNVLPEMREDR